MVQDNKILTIDLRVPASWEELTDNQLRYLFGLIAQDLSLVEVRTYCLQVGGVNSLTTNS